MATVTGLTAQKTMALLEEKADVGHTHSGGSGSGSSGPVGQMRVHTPGAVNLYTGSAGKSATFGNWATKNLISGTSFGIIDGASGFDYVDAGWYQIQFKVWAGFNVASGPLPTFLRLDMATWEGYDASWDLPCLPGQTDNIPSQSSRTAYGVQASLLTLPYHSPGAAETGGGEDGHAIRLSWEGDAVLTAANGGSTGNNALSMFITKLS